MPIKKVTIAQVNRDKSIQDLQSKIAGIYNRRWSTREDHRYERRVGMDETRLPWARLGFWICYTYIFSFQRPSVVFGLVLLCVEPSFHPTPMVAVKNIADYVEDEMEEIHNAAKIKSFTAHLLKERVTHTRQTLRSFRHVIAKACNEDGDCFGDLQRLINFEWSEVLKLKPISFLANNSEAVAKRRTRSYSEMWGLIFAVL
jgi:hypothetical protein